MQFQDNEYVTSLEEEYISQEQEFYRSMESRSVNEEEMREEIKNLCSLAVRCKNDQIWKQWLEVLQRATHNSKSRFHDFVNFILKQITSVLPEKEKCKQIYEVMMVACCGKRSVPGQVLNHYAWCLYKMERYDQAHDLLMDISNKEQYAEISFPGLYHTAMLLEKKDRTRAAKVWEEFLVKKTLKIDDDHYETLDLVREIAGNTVEIAEEDQRDPTDDLVKLYDLVIAGFKKNKNSDMKVFIRKAIEEKGICLRGVELLLQCRDAQGMHKLSEFYGAV